MKTLRFLMVPVAACLLTISVGCEPKVEVNLDTTTQDVPAESGGNDTTSADLPAGGNDTASSDLPAGDTP